MPTIDRSLCFVVGDVPQAERRRLRGVVFEAMDDVEVADKLATLHRVARDAAQRGEVRQFLEALDRRDQRTGEASRTFANFAEEWLRTCVTGSDLRERQVMSDETILALHLNPFFGKMHLNEIGARQIDQFKKLKRGQKHQYGLGYSAHSINNFLSVLRRVLVKAEEYRLVDRNPVLPSAWMSRERTPEDGRPSWTREEVARAVTCLREQWSASEPSRYVALMTQIVTGIRFSELRALQKDDLDLAASLLLVRRSMAHRAVSTPKNKKARAQPLPREFAEELHRWRLSTEGQLLFPGPTGGPLANNTLNRWFTQLCTEAKVRRISSHGARHTAGSDYAALGASMKFIGSLLGHADTQATERYTHVQTGATAHFVDTRWASWSSPQRRDATELDDVRPCP
ncbi:site-specific integrase [Myxococcus sp. AM010]|uniref:tyrosine-type recombinase/integrase n=1 Tax=Myxococcus sp. AM010 TaxID=2745138 RepID=UPI0015950D4C|nr:site-specific integrase [Myxococcus sp. AM010]NVJ15176.1 tyrosine-type recombinase/integrase [Myxococcus sp. AM010]